MLQALHLAFTIYKISVSNILALQLIIFSYTNYELTIRSGMINAKTTTRNINNTYIHTYTDTCLTLRRGRQSHNGPNLSVGLTIVGKRRE